MNKHKKYKKASCKQVLSGAPLDVHFSGGDDESKFQSLREFFSSCNIIYFAWTLEHPNSKIMQIIDQKAKNAKKIDKKLVS